MTKPIVWSERARHDLKNIREFFDNRNKSQDYSKKLLKTIRDSSKLIQKFPHLSISTDYNNVRGFIILEYIIFYEILENHILILLVWDCRRDPEQIHKALKS